MNVSTDILERIILPKNGTFSPDLARYILTLAFPKPIINAYLKLSKKAQAGNLSESEQAKLEEYLNANALLMILQSKARVSLKKHGSAA